jgi:hypothetical protein
MMKILASVRNILRVSQDKIAQRDVIIAMIPKPVT